MSTTTVKTRRRSTRRAALLRAMSVLLGLGVAWMIAEVFLVFHEPPRLRSKRWLLNLSQPSQQFHCYSSNPNGELTAVPDVSQGRWQLYDTMLPPSELPLEQLAETPFAVEYRLSKQGFRDREFAVPPPPGVLRIAGVGDSFAVGEGVPLERSLFKQVEGLLGEGYEVLNAARVGIDTHTESEILAAVAPRFGCRRALVVFIVNDVRLTAKLATRQDYINDLINVRDRYVEQHEARAWYTGHSRMVRLVGSTLAMRRIRRDTIQWYLDSYDPAHNTANLRWLEEDFRKMAETPDCQVALVLYPLMQDLKWSYPLADVHHRVAAMAREAGLPVLDLAPFFSGQTTTSLQVHPADHHPNGRAHEIAAAAIVDWLRREVPGYLDADSAPQSGRKSPAAAPPRAPTLAPGT